MRLKKTLSQKTGNYHDANFVVTGGTTGCPLALSVTTNFSGIMITLGFQCFRPRWVNILCISCIPIIFSIFCKRDTKMKLIIIFIFSSFNSPRCGWAEIQAYNSSTRSFRPTSRRACRILSTLAPLPAAWRHACSARCALSSGTGSSWTITEMWRHDNRYVRIQHLLMQPNIFIWKTNCCKRKSRLQEK